MFDITENPSPPRIIISDTVKRKTGEFVNDERLSEYGENPALQNAETEIKIP